MQPWLLSAAALAVDLPLSTQGCESLEQLGELRFTFNVESSGALKVSRAWIYRPKTREVVRTIEDDSISFTFGAPEGDEQTQADAQFINDSFWLMPQCHLSWASDATVTDRGTAPLPIGEGEAHKVTVRYAADGGGYTPGDAYDLFVQDDRIVAWIYRRRAEDKPTMITTFTDYVPAGPLSVATEHVSEDGEFRLFFTDVAASPSP
ncbi:MAG TPA: hypothetical protein ENK18_01840 [Deltaproteobacteria bacterium]|nr:hypothetical protein [Deltaproteobacteria bacterium]